MILCKEEHARAIDRAVFPGIQGGPLMQAIAGKAVAFQEALQPEFKTYQQAILDNAQTLTNTLTDGGLRLVSGGTDNHLMLVDLRNADTTGQVAEDALDEAGITINKNPVPFDSPKPEEWSGIRMGTAALSTRGMGEEEMRKIASMVADILRHPDDEAKKGSVRAECQALCDRFPLYPDME